MCISCVKIHFFPFLFDFHVIFFIVFMLCYRNELAPNQQRHRCCLHDTNLFLSFLNDSQFQTVADETSSNKLSQFANLNSVCFKAKSPVSHQNTKSGFLFLSPNVNILRFPILFHFFVAAVVAFVASLKPGKANTTYFFPIQIDVHRTEPLHTQLRQRKGEKNKYRPPKYE